MGGNNNSGSFIVVDIILLVTLIGLIMAIFSLKRFFFLGELVLVLAIILLAFIAMVAAYFQARFGWVMLSAIFAAALIDIIFIHLNAGMSSRLFFLLIVVAAIGFTISVVNIKRKEIDEMAEEAAPEIEKSFEPGRFVGSSTGRSYHAPRCDWAKKIREDKRVWFDSEEEAKKKGYKAHSCLD